MPTPPSRSSQISCSRSTIALLALLHKLLPRQLLEILVIDRVARLLRDIQAVDDLDRLADVARALLRVERAVRREQNLVVRIERHAAQRGAVAAERRTVDPHV